MALLFNINFKKSYKLESDTPYSHDNGLFFKGNNGCAVILSHGLTGAPNEMRFLANFLNKKGFSVSCPQLANHGQPLEILKASGWQDFYQSIRKAFEDLKESYNNIFVAGLSMGALLALLLAEEFPDRIAGVCCLSPTLFYDGWNVPWYQCFLPVVCGTFFKHFLYFKEEPPYGIKNEQIRQKVHSYYANASMHDIEEVEKFGYPYFPLTLLHQLRLLVKYLSKKLANITVPVQLIQAKNDDLTSVKNSQFIYDRINSEMKEIFLLYNSYHIVTADQERERVAQEMERFFNRILAGRGSLPAETKRVL